MRNQDRELVICALYSGGETMEAIASQFPSSYTGRTLTRERVRQILFRNGLGGSGRQGGGVDPLKVLGLVSECASVKAIAKRLDASEAAVAKVLHTLAPVAIDEMTAYRHEALRSRLLDRVRALAVQLGRTPTKTDFDTHGPAANTLQRMFGGSLTRAQAAAGLTHRKGTPHLTAAKRAEIALRYEPPTSGTRGGNAAKLAVEYGLVQTYIATIARNFRKPVAA